MTAPEVDIGDRMLSNLETFMHVHRAELVLMADNLELDIDLLMMEYIVAGFNSVKAIVMEAMEREGKDYVKRLAEIKGMLDMVDRSVEAVKE